MSPLNKACIIIGILILLASLCLYIKASADDGSGCSNTGSIMGQIGDCYTPKIYQQNQLLIQEQNQTNKLLASVYCDGWHTYGNTGPSHDADDYSQCYQKIWNETK